MTLLSLSLPRHFGPNLRLCELLDFGCVFSLSFFPIQVLAKPIFAHALDGQELDAMTRITALVSFIASGNHREELVFYLFDSTVSPIVLVILGSVNPYVN